MSSRTVVSSWQRNAPAMILHRRSQRKMLRRIFDTVEAGIRRGMGGGERHSLSRREAIRLYQSKWWEDFTDRQIVFFQLFEARLCLPFGRFHQAVEATLERPVWTHEFAFRDELVDELRKKKAKPTFEEIVNLLPAEKTIVVVGP